jgi:hypothetical protein
MNLLPTYEVWAWIRGYEGRYEISNRGRVRSWVQKGGICKQTKGEIIFTPTPTIRTTHMNKFRYWQTKIGNHSKGDYKIIRIHREVAIAFVPNSCPSEKLEVNHMNGDKACNEWWNFSWDTRLENIGHAFGTGLIKPALGENQSNTKLTNEKVLAIYNLNRKTKEIAKAFDVSTHTILDIKRGRTWWHLTGHKRHIKPSEIGKFKQ